jgi:hypothetical protein
LVVPEIAGIGAHLISILTRMTAPDPDDRHRSARAVLAALDTPSPRLLGSGSALAVKQTSLTPYTLQDVSPALRARIARPSATVPLRGDHVFWAFAALIGGIAGGIATGGAAGIALAAAGFAGLVAIPWSSYRRNRNRILESWRVTEGALELDSVRPAVLSHALGIRYRYEVTGRTYRGTMPIGSLFLADGFDAKTPIIVVFDPEHPKTHFALLPHEIVSPHLDGAEP